MTDVVWNLNNVERDVKYKIIHILIKQTAKALIRLCRCTVWSGPSDAQSDQGHQMHSLIRAIRCTVWSGHSLSAYTCVCVFFRPCNVVGIGGRGPNGAQLQGFIGAPGSQIVRAQLGTGQPQGTMEQMNSLIGNIFHTFSEVNSKWNVYRISIFHHW